METNPPPPKISKLEEKKQKEAEREKREQERLEKARQKETERLKREEEKHKREEEKRKREDEKEQERLKREEEKRKKDEEKEQERLKREEEKKKRDEEKRKKDEEKEQERLKREDEKRKKDDERKKKEEEKEQLRLKREDERLKKEQEKKQKDEEIERVKSKQAEFLTRFLQKTPTRKNGDADRSFQSSHSEAADTSLTKEIDLEVSVLETENEISSEETPKILFRPMPFTVRTGMALAPRLRRKPLSSAERNIVDIIMKPTSAEAKLTNEEKDSATEAEEPMEISYEDVPSIKDSLYLTALKGGLGRKSKKTEVKREALDDESEVQIIDPKSDENENPSAEDPEARLIKWRWKLVQFEENIRPAYWGTWKRAPEKVKGRSPFKQEEGIDYDFDSDDEWEAEPVDGEDLNSDKDDEDDEADAANPDDADDDEEGWMVPHGYLSDDEGASEDKRDKTMLKGQEVEFYKTLTQENNKMRLPIIETRNLTQYEFIFPPKPRTQRRNGTSRKSTQPFNKLLCELKAGTYSGESLESEEEDSDWSENDASSCESDGSSSDSIQSIASDDLDKEEDDPPCQNGRQKIGGSLSNGNGVCKMSP